MPNEETKKELKEMIGEVVDERLTAFQKRQEQQKEETKPKQTPVNPEERFNCSNCGTMIIKGVDKVCPNCREPIQWSE